MSDVLQYLNTKKWHISTYDHTVLYLGNCFTLQRKGGDSGKESGNHIQVKLTFSKLDISNKLEYMV